MLFTPPSVFFAFSALLSAVQAQPHRHAHQHGTSKRATGVVSGRGIVYADGNTGMGALSGDGKLTWSTDWTPWQDNPTNADLGAFVPQVWGLNNANGDSEKQCKVSVICARISDPSPNEGFLIVLTAFLNAASSFPKGSTILGFNEPEQ